METMMAKERKLIKLAMELGLKPLPLDQIKKGDLYLACYNSGPKLLMCKENAGSFIVPVEKNEYCYDVGYCLAIVQRD